ncbi:hypothetical protein C2S51_007887 [Perilla frutescens var. frutescens]|nr:hypothetical protein C2S51_007887 [Perilla frutescens var. frutescens]
MEKTTSLRLRPITFDLPLFFSGKPTFSGESTSRHLRPSSGTTPPPSALHSLAAVRPPPQPPSRRQTPQSGAPADDYPLAPTAAHPSCSNSPTTAPLPPLRRPLQKIFQDPFRLHAISSDHAAYNDVCSGRDWTNPIPEYLFRGQKVP